MTRLINFRQALLVLALLPCVGLAQAKTLVYCSEGSPEGFDTGLSTSGTTFDASSKTIFNRLVDFQSGTTNVGPSLAESWEVSNKNLRYTFHLRKGVKFHTTKWFTPTRDFNADDVIFTFMRQIDEHSPWGSYKADNNWDYFNGLGMRTLIRSIRKIDDYTVEFNLNRLESSMIANLGMDFASILSKEYADSLVASKNLAQFDELPVGTGPFQLVSYEVGSKLHYKAHEAHWNGRQPLDDLVFLIVPDSAERMRKLQAGECDIAPYPNPEDLPTLRADPNIKVLAQEGLNIGYLAYNTQMPPFNNTKVRRALNMAINKQKIVDEIFKDTGVVAKNPFPPTMWSYNDQVRDDLYNPEIAKLMLDEAGVKDLKMKIWAMPVARPYNPNAILMAEMIQSDFAKVGVEVEIVTYEWTVYLSKIRPIDRDGAILLGWSGDNGDPDNFLAVLLSCDGVATSNMAQWCHKSFDDLVHRAKATNSKAERTELYKKAQVIFKEQAPWATIAHSMVHMPMSVNVRNYKVQSLNGHRFDGVDLIE